MTGQLVLTPPKSSQRIRPVVTRAASVVVALGEGAHARAIEEALRQGGWDVQVAASDIDARRLVHRLRPTAVILETDPRQGESGWLTCKKLLMDRPGLRVVLVSPDPTDRERRLAQFVGAADLVSAAAACRVVRAICGFDVPSVN